ncbi:MAG TPA: FtsX-like permease family protein [Ktedonobacteraceae bacterium]|nr:FtsX-like permease family protein [Ktedonobacteraceae bacterium]
MAGTIWSKQLAELRTATTLATWRWRQQWLLLLISSLGVLSAMTLICALPLISAVTLTAGLRTTLRASPDNTKIEARIGLSAISSASLKEATQQVSSLFSRDLNAYVQTTGDLSTQFEVPKWLISGTGSEVILHGASMRSAAAHLQLLQGHLPAENDSISPENATLDVALTSSAANYMRVHLGSLVTLVAVTKVLPDTPDQEPEIGSQALTLRVVGIFQTVPGDSYWHNQTFQEPAPLPNQNPVPFHVLMSSGTFLQWADQLAQASHTRGIAFSNVLTGFLTYTLKPEHIASSQLNDLINSLQRLQADVSHMRAQSSDFNDTEATFPYLAGVNITGATLHDPSGPELLETFQNEILLGNITTLILTILIASLMLLFVGVLAQTQVERQTPALALLRSRGASSLQVLTTFFLQSTLLCLVTVCIAPLLALVLVRLVTPHILPSPALDALTVLPASFAELSATVGLYTLAALIIVLGAQLLAFIVALRGNMLTLRRETTRSTHRPLWLRWRLDLLLAVIALAIYGFAFYTQNIQQLLDTQSQLLLLTPLNLIAPLLLLLACLLFFLRFFPLFTRFLLRLAVNKRDAPSLLAVAQIARTPRQPLRLILLLGLALAFTMFTLIFAASQDQRSLDVAAYQAGADFSGYLPANLQTATQAQIAARYQSISGVTAVSSGYTGTANVQVNPGSPSASFRPLQVQAIDTQTFAQTAIWSNQDSPQTLDSLTAQLLARRPQALQQNVVPAILSSSAWQILDVKPGAIFHLFTTDGARDPVNYLAVAMVTRIPPANESVESGMLVDFQTLQAAYHKQKEVLPANYIWLQTASDEQTLTLARHTLSTAPLALSNLADRRAMAQINATDPLVLNVLSILSVGVCTSLLLALLANVLLPALHMQTRLTSFAFLRALGAAPSQILRLLVWEQGVVLVTALLLGLLTGILLAVMTVPALIVNGVSASGASSTGANAIYLVQAIIPARIVIPPTLLLALALLLLLCALALFLLSRMALRLTLSQQIRLNED